MATIEDGTKDACQIVVTGLLNDVFDAFSQSFNEWWPMDYRFEEDSFIGLSPVHGGDCYEDTEDGRRLVWGTIENIERPSRLSLFWLISPKRLLISDPQNAGGIDIGFRQEGHSVVISVEFHGFDNYGEDGQIYQSAMQSSAGWPYCLQEFRRFWEAQPALAST
ncbi:ATPase [Rhodobacteraceae bacterium RKSG542]|uniref:ATPase n=1 Tax=Pseudovibrio flavus TaxID=2529854 RepID=UPI0012BC197D|nr:ATPase [Pseudovibrio flavus]MTI18757.1 ATPase [Pseudovibrio flavus]